MCAGAYCFRLVRKVQITLRIKSVWFSVVYVIPVSSRKGTARGGFNLLNTNTGHTHGVVVAYKAQYTYRSWKCNKRVTQK